jgi:N-acetylmuramoyl-L-alanine amidase
MKPRSFKFLIILILGLVGGILFFNRNPDKPATTAGADTVTTQPIITPVAPKVTKIGLQAGHWKNDELPSELKKLRLYGGGSDVSGVLEWKINLAIAEKTAKILREMGYVVDVLPATIPQDYSADVFVAIHADGNDDPTVSGYRAAASDFDKSGRAEILSRSVNLAYATITGMIAHPNIETNMTEYYAFNYVKFHHSIDPKTPAILIETGFLTNVQDRRILVGKQDLLAKGIAQGVIDFVESQNKQT